MTPTLREHRLTTEERALQTKRNLQAALRRDRPALWNLEHQTGVDAQRERVRLDRRIDMALRRIAGINRRVALMRAATGRRAENSAPAP